MDYCEWKKDRVNEMIMIRDGKLEYRLVTDEEVATRRNYRTGDVRDYLDGDDQSLNGEEYMYNYGVSSLVNNESRVYKDGSWADRAFFCFFRL